MTPERMRSTRQLEDVPDLMHHIQSRLPVKEAARTSVLSKSWLKAWSTIPTLRFRVPKEQGRKHMKLVDVERTLMRYLRDNIPIESFELKINIKNQESASLAEKLIRIAVTRTCVKELSLDLHLSGASLYLPDEILSGENLTKIRVSASHGTHCVWLTTRHHPKCVSLRELHLSGVYLSEGVLDNIFLSCTLLVNIELLDCSQGLNTIKVQNLPYLYKLQIDTDDEGSTAFEIDHVPNLRFLGCNVHMIRMGKQPLIKAHSISLGSSVTELNLGGGMITDNTSLDMILKPGLPLLETLTLDLKSWTLTTFHFTSASIKRFSLLSCPYSLVDGVHVHAPKLCFFSLSDIIPSLLFPVSTLEQINFRLTVGPTLDASFFLKMREALTLSSKIDIHISTLFRNHGPPLDINIDDLRTRLPFPPARNVQQLSFRNIGDECLLGRSPFFDAFFEICHPEQVSAMPDLQFKHNNEFCKLMRREVLKKNKKTTTAAYWPSYLRLVKIQLPDKKWKTLTDSHTSLLSGPAPRLPVEFILEWH